jgi:hypothetical protein
VFEGESPVCKACGRALAVARTAIEVDLGDAAPIAKRVEVGEQHDDGGDPTARYICARE